MIRSYARDPARTKPVVAQLRGRLRQSERPALQLAFEQRRLMAERLVVQQIRTGIVPDDRYHRAEYLS